jgi:heat-inducible transcriptional repressor
VFVDQLLAPADLAASERRDIAYRLEDAAPEGVVPLASELLSHHTGQLGFVVAPRLDRLVLRHVSLVRLSSEKLLVVLISRSGAAHRRIIDDAREQGQAELDRMASLLNERVAGHTLADVRDILQREARALRREANRLLLRALDLGTRALSAEAVGGRDVVIETRLALLDQPEFSDPRRLRDLFEAIETKQRVLDVLRQTLADQGVSVAFGEELEDPALRRCAVVVAPYGASPGDEPLGALGVIGPSRMDYARVIPLVDYLALMITGKLSA